MDKSKNAIYLLLNDTCNLIKEISNPEKNKVSNANLTEKSSQKNEHLEQTPTTNSNTLFCNLIKHLSELNMDDAFKTLKDYMKSINKSNYEFLILNLIKLSLLEKNVDFTRVFATISYISKESFEFDISTYIQDFYIALAENKFEHAKIYLDIVCNANKVDKNHILTDSLLQVLENTEKKLQHMKKEEDIQLSQTTDTAEQTISAVQTEEKTEKEIKTDNFIENKVDNNTDIKLKENDNIENTPTIIKRRDSEEEFIERKYNLLLQNKGIVILKPMSAERRKKVHNMVERYPDIVSFSINDDNNRQIVLRYKPMVQEDINFTKLSNIGRHQYKEQDYEGCINSFLQILQRSTRPSAYIYAKLGLAYMRIDNKPLAIDYLKVANYLSKCEKKNYDYTELIEKLEGRFDEEDAKPVFYMKQKTFEKNETNYGIENIDQITNFINETGLDVESACEHFDMNEEQLDTVRLIYARDYYSQGYYKKGDEFLKSVEQSKHKTKATIELFNEVQKSKNFYINRPQENPRQLKLTMKPKKHQKN